MARLPRLCPPNIPQHIIQRGNNRQICFVAEQDYLTYAEWLNDYSKKYSVSVHAWVFMTNHVHILATPSIEGSISRMMQDLGRRYVRYFNREYQRTGTLWEGRFRSSLVQNEFYFLVCQRYIELNPVRANMVDDPADYMWSSYQCNALGKNIDLCSPHLQYTQLGQTKTLRQNAYRSLFEHQIGGDLISDIRCATNKGLVLGNDRFKDEVEFLTKRRVRPAKMGRPSLSDR